MSLAVLEELRRPTGAHAQALVGRLPGLLVQADDDSLLHTWDHNKATSIEVSLTDRDKTALNVQTESRYCHRNNQTVKYQ